MKQLTLSAMLFLLVACSAKKNQFDAEGNFETDETIVSSELPVRIIPFAVNEGHPLSGSKTASLRKSYGLWGELRVSQHKF